MSARSRFLRGRASLAAALLWHALFPAAFAQGSASPLTLAETLAVAAQQSRQLAAERAQADAAREMAVAAGQRPDPVLKFGINNLPIEGADRFSLRREGMTMRSLGLMQDLTRKDKLRARSERAELEVASAAVASQQTLAALQRDAAMAWFERSFQESMQALLLEQRTQAQLQVDAAESLYRSGKGAQADVFMARAQVEQLGERMRAAEQQLDVATARLARWVGEAASRPLPQRPDLALPAWTGNDLAQQALRHPRVAALLQQEAIAAADVKIAAANRKADWSVELMVSQRGPQFANMVSINFARPLQWDRKNRQDRELAARQAMAGKAAAEREDAQRAQLAEMRVMLQEWRGQSERLARYREQLIPLAGQRSAAALAAYRSGMGTLPMLLEARRGEVDMRMDALRVEMELARTWAELNFLLPPADAALAGADLPRSTR